HGVDVIALQQFHDAVGGGGDKGGQSQAHLADVGRVETVDVLGRVDGQRHLDLIDVLRQGHLHDEAIDVVVAVQLVDLRQQGLLADISGKTHQRGFETDALAGKHLVIHVGLAGTVVADQYSGE